MPRLVNQKARKDLSQDIMNLEITIKEVKE